MKHRFVSVVAVLGLCLLSLVSWPAGLVIASCLVLQHGFSMRSQHAQCNHQLGDPCRFLYRNLSFVEKFLITPFHDVVEFDERLWMNAVMKQQQALQEYRDAIETIMPASWNIFHVQKKVFLMSLLELLQGASTMIELGAEDVLARLAHQMKSLATKTLLKPEALQVMMQREYFLPSQGSVSQLIRQGTQRGKSKLGNYVPGLDKDLTKDCIYQPCVSPQRIQRYNQFMLDQQRDDDVIEMDFKKRFISLLEQKHFLEHVSLGFQGYRFHRVRIEEFFDSWLSCCVSEDEKALVSLYRKALFVSDVNSLFLQKDAQYDENVVRYIKDFRAFLAQSDRDGLTQTIGELCDHRITKCP